uniref:hypothetical protein n=1 Tax=Synechococcus sp. UW106 TaxID=368495 RepID=UPI0010BDC672|nr:hypothetical protein [Synechococcus sp. UW106]
MTETQQKIEKIIDSLFTGISLKEDKSKSPKSNHIYVFKRESKITHWFTSPFGRDASQTSGINSFLNAQTEQVLTPRLQSSLPPHIQKFIYTITPNARHIQSGMKISELTSLAYRTASMKNLVSIIPPGKVGRIIKTSSLKFNLLNEYETLKNLHSRVEAPQPLNYKAINDNFAFSSQTLMRGSEPKYSPHLDKQIASELQNLTLKNTTTSLKVQSEIILDDLHKKDLNEQQKNNIKRLLDQNKCNQTVEAALIHGDLRPANIKILNRQQNSHHISIGYLDWEFSKATGIGAIDYLRWRLDKAYLKATSLKELLELANIKNIRHDLRLSNISGHSLPINELIRLHVATHAVDRFDSFWEENNKNLRLNNLQNILNSDWPGNLEEN